MTRRKPSEEPLWIGLIIESLLGLIACSALFISPIHWTLKIAFAATLALVVLLLDSIETSNRWGRELQTIMIATIAERLDVAKIEPQTERTVERMVSGVQNRLVEIMSGGGEAEAQLIVFQLRCGLWLAGGLVFAHFAGPSLMRAFP